MGVFDGYESDYSEKDVKSKVVAQADNLINSRIWSLKDDKRQVVKKAKRLRDSDAKSDTFTGPWAGFAGEKEKREALMAQMMEREEEVKKNKLESEQLALNQEPEKSSTKFATFHGQRVKGRSWLSLPVSNSDKAPTLADRSCFIPKQAVHTWRGHTAGVQRVRLFPGTGHLLLSASMDGSCKIWDYYGDRECLMTYKGHSQAVREVQFTNDGRGFYSAGFDTLARFWDTETGQVVATCENDTLLNCLAVHPSVQHSIVVGCQNRKAFQWDMRDPTKPAQTYTGHQGAVNSATFLEDGRKFVTTSDDKRIHIYNYGIDVVDHYIADPNMHSIPAIALHPDRQAFVGQSMNNQIVTYQATGTFPIIRKKKFIGHTSAGYAIQPAFSADGRFLISGGSDGSLNFWDWNTTNLYKSIHAHKGVCISAAWHPLHSSRVVTCGWDGLIKLWD